MPTGIVNGFQATQGFLEVFGVPTAVPGVFTIGFYGRRSAFFAASCLAAVALTIQIIA
ncbi:hypothetical protein Clacol_002715 [Clathrus columnatus]|uniref:Uncharacterized protein n=1 Tax=Clathrus columnatus TaxID=1419009 RepID=A0AAV5A4F0_9AGAM|nr:hypothetical protein Clacol_002715 [Clathrus columnatus]